VVAVSVLVVLRLLCHRLKSTEVLSSLSAKFFEEANLSERGVENVTNNQTLI
jgi:preprotein translocase subunit SecG